MSEIPLPKEKTVSALLAARIADGTLTADPAQQQVAKALDSLIGRLLAASSQQGFLARLRRRKEMVTGIYIHGGVGRGKTMLMDMFHECLHHTGAGNTQIRLHFHDFMVMAQDLIHAARQRGEEDPVEAAAKALADRGRVMCFDEMEVRDIADAMILARLFGSLFERGVVVVATSNRHADDLYENGLHRDRFLPFIALLKSKCEMLSIADGQDWRALVLASIPSWYVPDDAAAAASLSAGFASLAGDAPVTAETVRVAGREITFEKVAGDVARIGFAALCEEPLGARDYLAVAGRFAGLVIDNIPSFTATNEPAARRFMWLIDALYDRNRFLLASAEAEIADLYQGDLYQFEFERTRSRLGEMTRRGE